jgi:hypothetical protein
MSRSFSVREIIFFVESMVELMTVDGYGLLLCWYFMMSSPEPQPNRITIDEDNNKSSIVKGVHIKLSHLI